MEDRARTKNELPKASTVGASAGCHQGGAAVGVDLPAASVPLAHTSIQGSVVVFNVYWEK